MTKKDLIRDLAERHQIPQSDIRSIVQGTFESIIETLARHGRIELRNFGVFEVRERRGRMARNPKTGVPVQVPSKRVVIFKAGRLMDVRIQSPSETRSVAQTESSRNI